jgi:hypothetical protein
MAKTPANPGQFKPGSSGNPGGRPKGSGLVRELAQGYTQSSIKILADIAKDKKAPHAARVSAANSLLDRGWGKPAQPVGGTDDLPPIRTKADYSEAELLAIAAGDSDGH